MYKQGHLGFSMFLSAPIAYLLLVLDLALLSIFFVAIVTLFASFPDIDIRTSLVKHRGITHTAEFGVLFGIVLSSILTVILVQMNFIQELSNYTPQFTNYNLEIFNIVLSFSLLFVIVFTIFAGFCAIVFHTLGDSFTPMGISLFYFRDNNSNFSFDLFKAKNSVANKTAPYLGLMSIGTVYGIHLHLENPLIEGTLIFIIVYVVGFFVWLTLVKIIPESVVNQIT